MAAQASPTQRAIVMDLKNAKPTDVDRRKCRRIVPMKIVGAGLSRTGTSSLRQALIDLGYNDCYHMASVFNENPRDAEMWLEAMDAKYLGRGRPYGTNEWDQLLGHCMAAVDDPAALFYEELLEAYPDAKVILTVRDSAEQWYESQMNTIVPTFQPIFRPRETFRAELWRKIIRFFTTKDAIDQILTHFNHQCYYRDIQTRGPAVYEDHNAAVIRTVPKDRLLVFNAKSGWKPLCEFLGKDVPEHPFPRLNDTKTFRKNRAQLQAAMQTQLLANVARSFAWLACVGFGGWLLFRSSND